MTAGTDAQGQFTALYKDVLSRQLAIARYGTNGGAAFVRPSSVPTRSATVLVSEIRYNDQGEAFESVDPMGRVNHRDFDDAGQLVGVTENVDPASTASDANRTVTRAFDGQGRLATITAHNAATGDQVTSFRWGVSAPESDLSSNQLLHEVHFPGDKLDVVASAYNRQGQVKERTDQNGTVHGYSFDKRARLTADELLALGLDIDGAITKIGLAYEVRGRSRR